MEAEIEYRAGSLILSSFCLGERDGGVIEVELPVGEILGASTTTDETETYVDIITFVPEQEASS